MKVTTSISVLALASMVIAGKQFQFCRDFDGPTVHQRQVPGFDITIDQDTTLLAFRLKDLPYTNIPFTYDADYDLEQNDDGFKVCTEEMMTKGECEAVGEFTIKIKGDESQISSPLMSVFAGASSNIFYPIDESGIYCVIGVHEYPDICVHTKFIQPNGSLPVYHYWKMIVLSHLVNPIDFLIALFAITKLIRAKLDKTAQPISMFGRNIYAFAITNAIHKFCEMNDLKIANDADGGVLGFWSFISEFVSNSFALGSFGFMVNILYSFSVGNGGLLYSDAVKPSKKYFFFIILYMTMMQQIRTYRVNGLDKENYFFATMQLISSLSVIGLFVILFKSSKATLNKIEDQKIKRSYKISRNLVIFTPILLSSISAISLSIWSYKSAEKIVKEGSNLDLVLESVFINALENNTHHRFIWTLLDSLSYFNFTIISLGFLIIWRSQLAVNEDDSEDGKIELVEEFFDEKH